MASRKAKKRSREQRLADQARYDDVTRRLRERIERGLPEMRELDEQGRYDHATRRMRERIEYYRERAASRSVERRESS